MDRRDGESVSNHTDWCAIRIGPLFMAALAVLFPCLMCHERFSGSDPVAIGTLVAYCFAVGWTSARIDHTLRVRPYFRNMLFLIASLAVSTTLIGENLNAQWWIIDDHRLLARLGPDGELSIGETLDVLISHPEVGKPSLKNERYRPALMVLTYLETFVCQDSPFRWYLGRLLIMAASLSLFLNVLWYWVGIPIGSVFIVYCLTYQFWGDIFCRLYTSEIYALPGSALFLWGAQNLYRLGRANREPSRTSYFSSWTILSLGVCIASGSKENFLFLLPLVWVLAFWLARKGRLWRASWPFMITITLYNVLIAGVVVTGLMARGVDQYQNSVSPVSRLQLIPYGASAFFSRKELISFILFLIVASRGIWIQRRNRASPNVHHSTRISFLLGTIFFGTFVFNYVFYNGTIPKGTRYDFPALLMPGLFWLSMYLVAEHVLADLKGRRTVRYLRTGLVLILGVLTANRGTESLHRSSHLNVVRTREFQSRLNLIVTQLKSRPADSALLVSHHPYDLELLGSVEFFLRRAGVTNDLFVRYAGPGAESFERTLFKDLIESIKSLSLKGHLKIHPLGDLPKGDTVWAIGISGETHNETETLLVRLY